MDYNNFSIVDCGWGYRVYGLKHGYCRCFDTLKEAQEYIDMLNDEED